MKIEIKSYVLNALLNKVYKALPSSTNIDALSGIKFIASNNKLTLIASNDIFRIECTTDLVNVIKPGECLILGKLISDVTKKTIESDITIIDEVNTISFTTKNTKFKLKKLDISLYPFNEGKKYIIETFFETNEFIKAVKKTIISAAINSGKIAFNGVNFKKNNNELIITATDSFRLSRKCIYSDEQHDFNIIIPVVALNELLKILDDKNFQMKLSNNFAIFITDDIIFETRLIDSEYPNCDPAIPTSFSADFTIKRQPLLNALDRVGTIVSLNNQKLVKMFINKNLCIETLNGDYGQAKESIDLEHNNSTEEIRFAISTKYLSDALKSFDEESVVVHYCEQNRPIIIKTQNNDTMIQLILPIRVDW